MKVLDIEGPYSIGCYGGKMLKVIHLCYMIVVSLFFIGCGETKNSDDLLFLEDTSTNQEEDDTQLILDDVVTEQENTQEEEENQDTTQEVEDNEEEEIQDIIYISVYVCGAVQEEGVYELEEGSRIFEAIELAGGSTEEAMESYLNLAEVMTDGQKIYVPTILEVEQGLVVESSSGSIGTSGNSDTGKVNINTATMEELMTLSGIGESKAEAIITYRETVGFFMETEEIQNITGIKEGVYEAIKDDITV